MYLEEHLGWSGQYFGGNIAGKEDGCDRNCYPGTPAGHGYS